MGTCSELRPASITSDGCNGPTGSNWSTIRGRCSQTSARYSSRSRAPSLSRHHRFVRRYIIPVEAAAAQLAQPGRHRPHAGPRLPFELRQVQFGDAVLRPQIGGEAHLGERVSLDVEGEALDAAGAEVPAGDDAIGFDMAERIGGHGLFL